MMTEEIYKKVLSYLRNIIQGTEWEGRVFTVGGCVRDLLLRRLIKDIDIVIEVPEGGILFPRWLQEHGFIQGDPVFYPTYGTSMFRLREFQDLELEAVCTRKERYPDSSTRNPETAFGSLKEDCFRRDLTINALYHNISTGKIIDLTGGINDMSKKVLRTTADPGAIFIDDPLRILRVIRFWGSLGEDWVFFPGILEAAKEMAGRLGILSAERIQAEFSRIITGPGAVGCLKIMADHGILSIIAPEVQAMIGCEQGPQHFGDVFTHTLAVIEKTGPSLSLRLAALLHDSGKPLCKILKDGVPKFYQHELVSPGVAETFLRRLKYPVKVIEEVKFLCANHMIFKQWGEKKINMKKLRRWQYEMGKERFITLLKLIDADNKSHSPEYCLPTQISKIREVIDPRWFTYHLPISGNDVMMIKGIEPGIDVKRHLEYLLGYQFSHPQAEKDELIEELEHVKPNNLPKV